MKVLKVTTQNVITIQEVSKPLLEALQSIVGGYIETVYPRGLKYGFCLIVDEEGVIKNKEINPIASMLYGTQIHGTPIVGDVVIMKEELEGLTEMEITEIQKSISDMVQKLN